MKAKKKSKINISAIVQRFEDEAKARYEGVRPLVSKQDEETRDAIDRIADQIERITPRQMKHGTAQDYILIEIPSEALAHNAYWMAVEIMKDLGQFDIRVENFHFDSHSCAVCGKPLGGKPNGVKRKVLQSRTSH